MRNKCRKANKIMETEVLKRYKTSKIIKLLKKGKLNLEDVLIYSIKYSISDLFNYILDNYNIDLDYTNGHGSDFLEIATSYGNTNAIEKLKNIGADINKKYKCGRKNLSIMIFIRDLDTFQYFENYFDKKEIKSCLESIIISTMVSYNVELLDYII